MVWHFGVVGKESNTRLLSMRKRLPYLDSIKGIAIALVVLGHILPMHTNGVSIWIYSFHLPLFYIVSGILHDVVDYSHLSVQDYVLKKTQSILYPYFVFSFIAILFLVVNGLLVRSFDSAESALIETLSLFGYSTFWFLPSLLFSEILTFCTARINKKENLPFECASIVAAVGVCILMSKYISQDAFKNIRVLSFVGRILLGYAFMLIGYYAHRLRKRIKLTNNRLLFCVVGFLLIGINVVLCPKEPNIDVHYFSLGNPVLFFTNALLGSYGIMLVCEALFRKNTVVSYLGRNSLIVLITHRPLSILYILKRIVTRISLLGDWGGYLFVFAGCILIELVLIYFINRFFRFLIDYEELKSLLVKIRNKAKTGRNK